MYALRMSGALSQAEWVTAAVIEKHQGAPNGAVCVALVVLFALGSAYAQQVAEYRYDHLGRLVDATYPSGKAIFYHYDENGNRIRQAALMDCNENGVDDATDIADATSIDCNSNEVPDECDISAGGSADENGNGVPDECEGQCVYDLDADGSVGPGDLSLFACCWLQSAAGSGCEGVIACVRGDFDSDAFVGPGDLSYLATAWLKSCDDPSITWPPGSPPAPLPSSGPPALLSAKAVGPIIELLVAAMRTPSAADSSTTAPSGINSVGVGQTYYVEVWCRAGPGSHAILTSVYVDVEVSGSSAKLLSAQASQAFRTFASGSLSETKVADLGGSRLAASIDDTSPHLWQRIGTIQVAAVSEGAVNYAPSESSIGIAALGRGLVPWAQITVAGAQIEHVAAGTQGDATGPGGDSAETGQPDDESRSSEPRMIPDCGTSIRQTIVAVFVSLVLLRFVSRRWARRRQ